MAFTATETKMVIAYNNKVTAANVTAVTLANATADSSFPAANLKYDDAWRMLKAGAGSASPTITLQFAVAQAFTCLGIMNHNLGSGGYAVDLAYSSDNVSYTNVGSATLISDANLLLRFPVTPARVYWKITLSKSTPWPAFFLGSVFLGTHQTLDCAPNDGGWQLSRSVPIDVMQSAGEAQHLRFGATKFTSDSEITLERMSQLTYYVLTEVIFRSNQRRQIALIAPDVVHQILPYGEHLFAYLLNVTDAAREGASQTTHKKDVVLKLLGVM